MKNPGDERGGLALHGERPLPLIFEQLAQRSGPVDHPAVLVLRAAHVQPDRASLEIDGAPR